MVVEHISAKSGASDASQRRLKRGPGLRVGFDRVLQSLCCAVLGPP